MSRRRVSPRSARGAPTRTNDRVESASGREWNVRSITGSGSTKPYRCPGCDHMIAMATPHVLIWPVEKSLLSDAAIDERRHWHLDCWKRRLSMKRHL